MATQILKSLALAAAISSAAVFAQSGTAPAPAGTTSPSVTMPPPSVTAPAPNLTLPPQPSAQPGATAPGTSGNPAPGGGATGGAPSTLGQGSLQPLGVPFDRSREANYRRDMSACASKAGADLQACQNMVNNQYEVDPNSIRMLPSGTMLR